MRDFEETKKTICFLQRSRHGNNTTDVHIKRLSKEAHCSKKHGHYTTGIDNCMMKNELHELT